MVLSQVKLKGFRNFKDSTINFNEKTLIIGANDVGKTNLLWAIRLLLDRSLSDYDIEPNDNDFFAYEETDNFKITLKFENVTDDCIVSKLKGKISDDDVLILRYEAFRDPQTKTKSYKLFAGSSITTLEEIEDRYYRKVLNLKYISSRRDLIKYIAKEKAHLFRIAKENRSPEQVAEDEAMYFEVEKNLEDIDSKIPKLNFVKNATSTINDELSKLSLHHTQQTVSFDSVTSNLETFINSVSISANSNGKSVVIGGDGRLNQIYLSLWASRNQLREENLSEVTIFCIEEPEAHLHPHQQRKLADYLNKELFGQVFITTHSPQITSEFSPNSIVRLYNTGTTSQAASNGCSEIIDEAFEDFGYRMSIIPAEAFFANVVFLVEGPSEEIFYKTLAKQLNIDLDRLNLSILMVDGIGFKTYLKILEALKIEWVLRTDNDIFKVPRQQKWRFSGLKRCISFYREYYNSDEETDRILDEHEFNITWEKSEIPSSTNKQSADNIIQELIFYNMYLSSKDLENDLVDSEIFEDLSQFYGYTQTDKIVLKMQSKKAINMYQYLRKHKESLFKLKDHKLAAPLLKCVQLANK